MTAREKAESIVRHFLGTDDYTPIAFHFSDLVDEIADALEDSSWRKEAK